MPQKIKRKGHFILTTTTPPLWVHFFKLTIPQRKTGQKYLHSPPFRNSTFFLKPLRKNNFETPLRKSYHGGGRGWILHGMVHIKTKVLTQHFSPQKFLSKTSSENSYRGECEYYMKWPGVHHRFCFKML